MKGLLGKKVGVTRIFDDHGNALAATVLEGGPCTVISQRTMQKNGYSALQLGYGTRKIKNVSSAVRGVISIAGYTEHAPERIKEIRLDKDPSEAVGDKLNVDIFNIGDYVDVIGTAKGRGFQGVVKRYGFGGGRASHGGDWTRRTGSIGMCEKPGKVYRGRKMPGRMGNVQRTVQNLKILKILKDDNILIVKGAVPGPNGHHIVIREAKKIKSDSKSK